jgi:hypothetical protein
LIVVAVAIVAIGAYAFPIEAVFGGGHHGSSGKHHGSSVQNSGNVGQSVSQSNSISASSDPSNSGSYSTVNDGSQSNTATNTADVNIHGGKIKNSGNVGQTIDQANSIEAKSSGPNSVATADHNTQTNNAKNTADVNIGAYHGGKIKDSGNVGQTIDQANSIKATSSGPNSQAHADQNTQSNTADNNANVHIK